MVYSSVRRKHFSTAKSNIIPIENLSIFKAEKERNRKGDTWYIQRKESSLGLYCSNNTQMKKYKTVSQNISRIYKYKKAL